MSVIVKNMEMPQNCQECWLYIEGACYAKGYRDYRLIMDTAKPDDCPLVEIPTPHGRLIDADELHDAMYHRAFETDGDTMWQSGCWVRYRAIEQIHESQPTIIEAEGSEE